MLMCLLSHPKFYEENKVGFLYMIAVDRSFVFDFCERSRKCSQSKGDFNQREFSFFLTPAFFYIQ